MEEEYSKYYEREALQSELQTNACALPNHLHLNPVSRVLVYLVAAHVVTLVHDHRFATFVALSNIQAGFRALVLNLRANMYIIITFVKKKKPNLLGLNVNDQKVCLTAPCFTGFRSGMNISG